jgi:hypothetical protein
MAVVADAPEAAVHLPAAYSARRTFRKEPSLGLKYRSVSV